MAVVGIALILTIVAVNSYSSMQQRRSLRAGADSVRDVLMNARSLAVSRNAWHRVVLQLRDPDTGQENFGFWIDEIDPNTSTDPNPVNLDAHRRGLVVPWKSLPESVEIVEANINGTSYTTMLANPYLVVRFMPNGVADSANILLSEDSHVPPHGTISSEVRLYPATAQSKIVADMP